MDKVRAVKLDFKTEYYGVGIVKTPSAVKEVNGEVIYSKDLVGKKCFFHLFNGNGKSYTCMFVPADAIEGGCYETYFSEKEIQILKLESAEVVADVPCEDCVSLLDIPEDGTIKYEAPNAKASIDKDIIKKEIEQDILNNLRLKEDYRSSPYPSISRGATFIVLKYKDKELSRIQTR